EVTRLSAIVGRNEAGAFQRDLNHGLQRSVEYKFTGVITEIGNKHANVGMDGGRPRRQPVPKKKPGQPGDDEDQENRDAHRNNFAAPGNSEPNSVERANLLLWIEGLQVLQNLFHVLVT